MEMVFKQRFKFTDLNFIVPKDNEIVTCVPCSDGDNNCWHVLEYPKTKDGRIQDFDKRLFRPLSDVLAEISIAELMEEVTHA